MRVLIVGCGYVGLKLGTELIRRGHSVIGIRRSADAGAELQVAGIQPVALDLTDADAVAKLLPRDCDWVVNLVSSNKGGPTEYRQTYLEGTGNLLQALSAAPPRKFVYTSSSSVYGQDDGSQVKETSPTTPVSETANILLETERLLLDSAAQTRFPAVILRVAGIYGPERGHLFKQFLKNEAKIAGRGERHMNMIHVDDLVGIIIAALTSGRSGEIYNAVDDEPVPQMRYFEWLAETLGKWKPPFSTEEEQADRKRGLTNKKVLNRKLKMELGYQFKYPTFRHGYTAEIQRLQDAGQLHIEPDPR